MQQIWKQHLLRTSRLTTDSNEQGINVKGEAFYKIDVQMLLSGVLICFYINVYLLQEANTAFLTSSASLPISHWNNVSGKWWSPQH